MKYKDALAKKIVVEEYYIHLNMAGIGATQFKIRYVVHNGYTRIEPLPEYNHKLDDFTEWFKLRSDLNTRYDQPHWWHPIRYNRSKRLTLWAIEAIQEAFNQYTQAGIDERRNK